MSEGDVLSEEERWKLAHRAVRSLVSQCRAHARMVMGDLSHRLDVAHPGSPYGRDLAEAKAGLHLNAYKQIISEVEALNNALIAHLCGLEVLLKNQELFVLPLVPIVRAIAEVASSVCWMLQPASTDERAARGYASIFFALEQYASNLRDSAGLRDALVGVIESGGGRVQRRGDTDAVGTVHVGRAHAKISFKYQHRMERTIPFVAGVYGQVSAMVHGETFANDVGWETPDTVIRLVGKVAVESTRAWSEAVNAWTGAETSSFLNRQDEDDLIRSLPPELLAKFTAGISASSRPEE